MSFAPTALQFDSTATAHVGERIDVLDAIAHAASTHAVPAQRGECTVELDLRHAGRRRVALRYEILGDRTLPAVFVAGGISAHRHLAASTAFAESGWWEQQVGA